MVAVFLNESPLLRSKNDMKPFLRRVFAGAGIHGFPGQLEDEEFSSYRGGKILCMFPDGRKNGTWFFRWNEGKDFGIGIFAMMRTEVYKELDGTKTVYIYPALCRLHVFPKEKQWRVYGGRLRGAIHAGSLTDIFKSADARAATKFMKAILLRYYEMSFKELEDASESFSVEGDFQ